LRIDTLQLIRRKILAVTALVTAFCADMLFFLFHLFLLLFTRSFDRDIRIFYAKNTSDQSDPHAPEVKHKLRLALLL